MIEENLAIRMFSSRNNFTSTLVKHLKDNHIFDFIKVKGVEYTVYKDRLYQFATGEGNYAEVRQGVNAEVGLIFYSTSHSTLYRYEASELIIDNNYNKINTSGVKLFTKKSLLDIKHIMQHSLAFDKDLYIKECKKYTAKVISLMELYH